jgi:hypothetical protein
VTQGENLEEQVSTCTQGLSECRDRRNAGTHRLKNGPHLRSEQRFLRGRNFGEGQGLDPNGLAATGLSGL